MGQSLIRKTTRITRLDGSAAVTNTAAGVQVRIPLRKESLIAEHYVRIRATGNYTGNQPTSLDPRRFVDNASIETSDGRRVFLTGAQVYDLNNFYEDVPTPQSVLASNAPTCDFQIGINHANDEALQDLMAAIPAGSLNTFDLVLNFAAGVGGFVAGVLAAGFNSFQVDAYSVGYPGLLGAPWVGKFRHTQESQQIPSAAASGSTLDVRLTSGNLTRAIMIHANDITNGVRSDTLISDVRLVINGEEKKVTTWRMMKNENEVKRGGFLVLGCAALDFGDDEAGWLDLRGVNEPKLQITLGTAVASMRFDVAQDYTEVRA